MPNLPGATIKKDLAIFKKVFTDPNFQPDQIKIYPCVVTRASKLYHWWRQGKYKPYTAKQLAELLINIKKIVPYYVRIIRVIRDIPETSVLAGNKISNLRHLLKAKCKCIRCREVGHQEKRKTKNEKRKTNLKLFFQKYKAGDGMEYFLSFESPDRKILYAFCRLRIPKIIPPLLQGKPARQIGGVRRGNKFANRRLLIPCFLLHTPMIRELHTYGQMVPINVKIKSSSQHQGLGKKLMAEAEKIAKAQGFSAMAVIAGIGVRKYYQRQGYKLRETYLVKNF
jgi:elongator complex protein 3